MNKSQRKGKVYERWIANWYRELGFPDVARGWQSRDGADASDVVVPGFSIECKHHKRCPNVFDAMDQALKAQKDPSDTPVVHIREDRRGDLVVLRLDDWHHVARLVVEMGHRQCW